MKWLYFISVLFILLQTQPAASFFTWQGEQAKGDARLLLRGFAIASQKPSNPSSYQKRDDEALGGLARVIVETSYQHNWSFEFNAYQTYIDESLVSASNLGTVKDVERSAALERSLSNDKYAYLAVDRLSARWSAGLTDIRVGRQPINLGAMFFFSPNDFFAPFEAQAFYRVYKPGVDAVRAEMSLGELDTFSLISVLGYEQQDGTDSGWSDSPDSSRNSYLAHYITNKRGFEWGFIVGNVRRTRIVGGSISGELFDWLGIRGEGHRQRQLDSNQYGQSKFTIGFDHRWQNSLMLQLELFYHGPGATEVAQYDLNLAYPARRYQALGLSYEFTPLLSGELSVLRNQVDGSRLYTLYTIYSLSNESELEMSLSIPDGQQPDGDTTHSEFGNYSRVFNIEVRAYF